VVAPTYGAAHAAARFRAESQIIHDEGIDAALAPLPLEALRLPVDLPAGLRRMGFERIGDIAHRPRAPLQLRFGAELGRRLEQRRRRRRGRRPRRAPDRQGQASGGRSGEALRVCGHDWNAALQLYQRNRVTRTARIAFRARLARTARTARCSSLARLPRLHL
jgi:hypothetical protein